MSENRYVAFISYSHDDIKWANWLHRNIESYRIPKKLARNITNQPLPKRLIPVFKDREELPASASLSESIKQAITESDSMIVICSPSAAQSRFVNQEILAFRNSANGKNLYPIIVGGEPNSQDNECFPDSLKYEIDSEGNLTDELAEPIAADARPGKDRRADAKLKIVAGLIGVGFDELKQRETRKQFKLMFGVTLGALAIMILTITLSIRTYYAQKEAERRREQAEDLIGFMLGDLREKLVQLGKLEVLDSVGDKALDYFMSLEATDITPEALANRAKAMRQIGDIRISQGRLSEGIVAFEESLTLDRELLKSRPDDTSLIFNIAQSHFYVGFGNWRIGDLNSASNNFNRYLEYARRLVLLEPAKKEWQVELHYALSNLGTLAMSKGNYDEALSHFELAAEIIRSLLKQNANDPDLRFDLAGSVSWLASAYLYSGKLAEAVNFFQEQVNLATQLLQDNSENMAQQFELANALILLGDSQRITGDSVGETSSIGQALVLSQMLSSSDPQNRVWQSTEASSEMHQGITDLASSKYEPALFHLQKSVAINKDLIEIDPNQQVWQRQLAGSLIYLSLAQHQGGDLGNALTSALHAKSLFETPTDVSSADELNWQVVFAKSALQLGRVYSSLGETKAASEEWQFAYDQLYPWSLHSADFRVLDPLFEVTIYLDRTSEAHKISKILLDMGYRDPLFLAKCGEFCGLGGKD